MHVVPPARELYCSFCGKREGDVFVLVEGPAVFICNECYELVGGIMKEKMAACKHPLFEPCTMVNDVLGLTTTMFEDVAYVAKPLHDGAPHFIDELRATDDNRLVGVQYWVGLPTGRTIEAKSKFAERVAPDPIGTFSKLHPVPVARVMIPPPVTEEFECGDEAFKPEDECGEE